MKTRGRKSRVIYNALRYIPDTNGQGAVSHVGVGSISSRSCPLKVVAHPTNILLQVVATI
jgi:hypothetical protein